MIAVMMFLIFFIRKQFITLFFIGVNALLKNAEAENYATPAWSR
jgi:hypothetical protein